MKKMLLLVISYSILNPVVAQKMTSSGNGFHFIGSDKKELKLDLCTPSMFRVRTSWSKSFEQDESWMVTKYNWPVVSVTSSEQKSFFQLQTADLLIKINKSTLQLIVWDKQGKLLSTENISSGGSRKNGDSVLCTKQLA